MSAGISFFRFTHPPAQLIRRTARSGSGLPTDSGPTSIDGNGPSAKSGVVGELSAEHPSSGAAAGAGWVAVGTDACSSGAALVSVATFAGDEAVGVVVTGSASGVVTTADDSGASAVGAAFDPHALTSNKPANNAATGRLRRNIDPGVCQPRSPSAPSFANVLTREAHRGVDGQRGRNGQTVACGAGDEEA